MAWASPLADKPGHVNAIGMISIENANLELVLAALMSAALMMPRRVAHAIFFTPRAATVRIEILIAAARAELSPNPKAEPDSILEAQKRDAFQKVDKLAKRSLAVIQRRHDVMHDAWAVDDEKDEPVVRSKIQGAALWKEVPIQTLLDLIRDYRSLIDDVGALVFALRRNPPK